MKTAAGTAELKAHALVKQAATQNLLRAIDGVKSEEMLVKYLIGVTAEDVRLLHRLGLIQPVDSHPSGTTPPAPEADVPAAEVPVAQSDTPAMRQFASVLAGLVSAHLGLAGMEFAALVERARTIEELRAVALRVLARLRATRGEQIASQAQKALFG